MNKDNQIAKILQIIGIAAMVIGVFAGILYATSEGLELLGPLRGFLGFTVFVNGVIVGIIFLGFAEVIKLLQGIYNQGEERTGRLQFSEEPPAEETPEDPVSSVEREEGVPEVTAERLDRFYSKKGRTLEKVRLTGVKDVYLVTADGRKELIEMNVLTPDTVSENTLQKHPELRKLTDET